MELVAAIGHVDVPFTVTRLPCPIVVPEPFLRGKLSAMTMYTLYFLRYFEFLCVDVVSKSLLRSTVNYKYDTRK